MRWWFILFFPWTSSCLYVGGINHAPSGTISLNETQSALAKWGHAVLAANAVDTDGDEISYAWRVTLSSSEDGINYALLKLGGAPKDTSGYGSGAAPILGTGPELALSLLPLRGTYQAEVRVFDSWGASSTLHTSFKVENKAPMISPNRVRIERDPQASEDRVFCVGPVFRREVSPRRPSHAVDLANLVRRLVRRRV